MKIQLPKLTSKHTTSLDASWKEGVYAQIMLNITEYYFIPLGLLIGASVQQIGFLVAIPHLLGASSQLLATRVLDWLGSRKRFLVRGALVQASVLLPVALLPLFPGSHRITFFIICVVIFRVLGNLIGTVWGSLMSDYLAAEERGKYFGWRTQVTGIAGLIAMMSAGIFLSVLKIWSASWAFFILFFITALSRFISAWLMTRMEDLPMQHKEESDFTFFQFIRRFRESNFVKFIAYAASITFATSIASPYFSVYMIRDLHFPYFVYMTVQLASVAAGLFASPIWGRHADHVGNAKVLKVTSFLIPLIPLLWLVSKNPFYLFLVECFAGFVWGGFNLCTVNFIFDAVSPDKRVRCLGYFNFINGTAIFLGASLGGYLATLLPPLNGFELCRLFLLSAFLRACSHFLLSGKFHEVRASTKKVDSDELFFSVVGIQPLIGQSGEWNIIPKHNKS